MNKVAAGSLGSSIIKWSLDKCKEEALKYKTRNEFQKNSACAYSASRKNKWLDDVCSHISTICLYLLSIGFNFNVLIVQRYSKIFN